MELLSQLLLIFLLQFFSGYLVFNSKSIAGCLLFVAIGVIGGTYLISLNPLNIAALGCAIVTVIALFSASLIVVANNQTAEDKEDTWTYHYECKECKNERSIEVPMRVSGRDYIRKNKLRCDICGNLIYTQRGGN